MKACETRRPLVLDVREVLETRDSRSIRSCRRPGSRAAVGPRRGRRRRPFEPRARSAGQRYARARRADRRVPSECRRCLRGPQIRSSFEGLGAATGRRRDVWEEGYEIKDQAIDLEPMARDTVLLRAAGNPLCREDCAGPVLPLRRGPQRGPCACPEESTRGGRLEDLRPRDRRTASDLKPRTATR